LTKDGALGENKIKLTMLSQAPRIKAPTPNGCNPGKVKSKQPDHNDQGKKTKHAACPFVKYYRQNGTLACLTFQGGETKRGYS